MADKITKKVHVRVGCDDEGRPVITAHGEDDECTLSDGNVDESLPYRDFALVLAYDAPHAAEVAVDVPAPADQPPEVTPAA